MIDEKKIRSIAEEALAMHPDVFIVDVVVRPGNVIIVELDSDNGLGIDDIVVLSKKIESQLDRDAEDFELEVGTSGLTSPLKLVRQYEKNIGNEVEVLSKKGQKITGVLKSADENGFAITITRMEKPEGAKRKIVVEEDLAFKYEEVKYTKYLIRFK